MEQPTNWSPKEVRTTIVLIMGILFFCAGIYLLFTQTKAEGSIVIKLLILTGTIQAAAQDYLSVFSV